MITELYDILNNLSSIFKQISAKISGKRPKMKRNRQFPTSFFIRVYFSEYVPEKLQPYKKFEQKCRWQKKRQNPVAFLSF